MTPLSPSVGDALRALGGSIESIDEVRVNERPCCELAYADGLAAGERRERAAILAELDADVRQYQGTHRPTSGPYWALKRFRDRIIARGATPPPPEVAP